MEIGHGRWNGTYIDSAECQEKKLTCKWLRTQALVFHKRVFGPVKWVVYCTPFLSENSTHGESVFAAVSVLQAVIPVGMVW
jgi:hypothetical protein